MTKLFLTVTLLGLAAGRLTGETSPDEDLAKVLYLLRSGVPAEAVRAYVEAEEVYFPLEPEDLVALKQAGAEGDFLVFLLERSARATRPAEPAGVEIVYESEGFRVFRQKDAAGREVLVLTNLDEKGRRMDRPPDLPEEAEPRESQAEPVHEVDSERRRISARSEIDVPEPYWPAESEPYLPAPAPPPPERRESRSMFYAGPFYHFRPSNLPGPGSPWSPVFQIVPSFWPFGWPPVTVYPFAQLAPVYPPGFSYFYPCARWR